jgi:hypothetical protein
MSCGKGVIVCDRSRFIVETPETENELPVYPGIAGTGVHPPTIREETEKRLKASRFWFSP